ncbi:Hypothetical protein FKW44_011082 [Caligus rogercresseyi]|uniref:Uncharacterized protein n=1 Tax=Caligus rogercresseyi TaxID=217165 RepID=A0A7T8K8L2_CALRO|nr:Hypothetical protein FKW44_011082 [Caligus rogercresseyi]
MCKHTIISFWIVSESQLSLRSIHWRASGRDAVRSSVISQNCRPHGRGHGVVSPVEQIAYRLERLVQNDPGSFLIFCHQVGVKR